MLDALPWPVAVLASDGTISYVNRSWPDATQELGRHFAQALADRQELPPGVVSSLHDAIAAALQVPGQEAVLEFAEVGDPPARWFRVHCSPVAGGGALVGIEDVSAQRQRELELALQADHDPLTGLANRRRFMSEGARMLALAKRRGSGMALLFIDLDSFKLVNDRAGHAFGDAVLQQVATRLKAGGRSGDLLARIGGDEFVVLLNDVDSETGVRLANRYRSALQDPPVVPGNELPVSASIGMAWFPGAATRLETLLRLADAAMYRAKSEQLGVVMIDESPSPA